MANYWKDFLSMVDAECIICVNTEISTKDDERDLRVQGKVYIPQYLYETKWSITFCYCIQNNTLQQQQETNAKVDWQLPCKEYKYRRYLIYWITLH